MSVVHYVIGFVICIVISTVIVYLIKGGSKYDGTIGLEQQDDGHWAVGLHYDLDELYSKKKTKIVLKVMPDRINPIANNGNLEESNKEE